MTTTATTVAHPNIALIKYWGRHDEAVQLPAIGSLSLTLGIVPTTATVSPIDDPSVIADSGTSNGQEMVGKDLSRVQKFLDLVRERAGSASFAKVDSTNEIPTGAGLASSASGFGVLALAVAKIHGLDYTPGQLSALTRRGSGPACRSIFGDLAERLPGDDDASSYAVALPDSGLDLSLVVVVLASGCKKIDSRATMRRAVETSPLFPAWVEQVSRDIEDMKAATAVADPTAAGELAEASAMCMYATILGTLPLVRYWNPGSVVVLDLVATLRDEGTECYTTMDAKPNMRVLCRSGDAETIADRFRAELEDTDALVFGPSPGAYLVWSGEQLSNTKGEPIKGESIGRDCGKLYLIGEYVVMSVEGLAVIVGIDRYVTVRCHDAGPTQPVSRVYSSHYGPQGRVIDIDAPDDTATHTIFLVYRITVGELENTPERSIDTVIESDLDDADSGAKYGLGSSGAVTMVVTRALGVHLGLELNSPDVYKIAVVAMFLAGAAGSDGSIARSAHGGAVLYRRPNPTTLAELVATDTVATVAAPRPSLRIDARADLGGLQLLVGWTVSLVKTDLQLKKAGSADRDFVCGISTISERLRQALADGDHTVAFACLRENRTLLQDYECECAAYIETEKLKALADITDGAGVAGKSSGSGGGDCGIALVGISNGADAEETAADITVC